MKIKPLLAAKVDLEKLIYPVLVSPKLDGIRCLMVDGVAMTRTMKPIPNKFIQEQLSGLHGLDGELMVEGDFNSVQSAIMSKEGKPEFTYYIFDNFLKPNDPYGLRLRTLYIHEMDWHPRIKIVNHTIIHNEKDLSDYLDLFLQMGYEGLMVRHPEGPYKFGRSTVNERTLLKFKRFLDDEGVLIEVTEKMHNENELEEDELGYAKRSSKKENLVPAGTAGSCVIEWKGLQFRVGFGPGIDDSYKKEIWDTREELKGQLVKFSYQELSKDGVPRFGKMLSIRHPDEL